MSLVIALTCQSVTSTESLSLSALIRVLVQHSALLDCHVLVLALNTDHVRWSDVSDTCHSLPSTNVHLQIISALVDCHNVPQRESRARVK